MTKRAAPVWSKPQKAAKAPAAVFRRPRPQRHPWQRGTNENTNGLLREYFPKGKSLEGVTDEEVQEVYDRLNMRPRKCLGYRTSYEVHHSVVLHLI